MSLKTLLQGIANTIKGWLPWAKKAISKGITIGNEIKDIANNPAWDIAVSFTSTKLDDEGLKSLRIFLAFLVKDMKLAEDYLDTKADASEILRQGSHTISAMYTTEARIGTLNTISAAAGVKIAELESKQLLPMESALSGVQPAYAHPELLEVK